MSMNFHDDNMKMTYASREADPSWLQIVKDIITPTSVIYAADIGCGGGIYTKALYELGINNVIGIDYSEAMLAGAKENCKQYPMIHLRKGHAYQTHLPDKSVDFVLERALIHHLDDLFACFTEASRILMDDGVLLVQDRTLDDCLKKGTHQHIRGWIFEMFPQLKKVEERRRISSVDVKKALFDAGFNHITETKLMETRKMYSSKQELLTDIQQKNGRSILHYLNNHEMDRLLLSLDKKIVSMRPIIEKDYWTVWKAQK
ncbi:class I SAM-dependent methyltransferase [Virgibacillus salexigens]|uniref:SAM-dependent methyltransferase n=1 Tax=Virgibacillus kapii TaxID=1638645 RepID=A0ABQ2DW15_9BACI|nr:class I SAM-dependent methyltransferase [Virgibacillus kapii]GGJ74385.1 SAM-dependent methyltransferase [Virgibacillus kapii]